MQDVKAATVEKTDEEIARDIFTLIGLDPELTALFAEAVGITVERLERFLDEVDYAKAKQVKRVPVVTRYVFKKNRG